MTVRDGPERQGGRSANSGVFPPLLSHSPVLPPGHKPNTQTTTEILRSLLKAFIILV